MKENKVAQVRNAIKTGVFCKQWWKQLVSLLAKCKLSKQEKIMVYCKIAEGLFSESLKLSNEDVDYAHLVFSLHDIQNSINEERFKRG